MVDVDAAIPLGLITTELLTNAYRHAYPADAGGIIRVGLTLQAGIVELSVIDNGVGLPQVGGSPASSGLWLVQALAKQIGGSFTANAGPGARCSVLFPLEKHSPQSPQ